MAHTATQVALLQQEDELALLRALVIAVRGGETTTCDRCGAALRTTAAIPRRSGEWVCRPCVNAEAGD